MSKEEIQELKSEIKRLKNLLRLRGAASPVSPLAPKGGFPNLPEIGGGAKSRLRGSCALQRPGRRHAGEDINALETQLLAPHKHLNTEL